MSEFLPVPSEQEWTESDRQWFELVRSLRSQVVQLQTTVDILTQTMQGMIRDKHSARGLVNMAQSALDEVAALAQKPEEKTDAGS